VIDPKDENKPLQEEVAALSDTFFADREMIRDTLQQSSMGVVRTLREVFARKDAKFQGHGASIFLAKDMTPALKLKRWERLGRSLLTRDNDKATLKLAFDKCNEHELEVIGSEFTSLAKGGLVIGEMCEVTGDDGGPGYGRQATILSTTSNGFDEDVDEDGDVVATCEWAGKRGE